MRFVVVLTDDDGMEDKLKAMDKELGLKKVMLSVDNPQGPPKYKIAKDAGVTVLLYNKRKVVKNFAFETGKFEEKDVEAVVSSVKDILPKD